MRFPAATLAALLLPAALAAQERQVLTGESVTIYNLAGEVRLEAGTGSSVTVDVTRGGPDARRLEVRLRGSQMAVIYPSDEVVYREGESGWRSSTSLRVREDGSFGGGTGMDGRRTVVRSYGSGLEAHADLVVRVPKGKRVALHLAAGEVTAVNVEGDLDVDVHSASVEARGTKGQLYVDAGSGSVRVEEASGELEIDTGSGEATVRGATLTRATIETGSGSVELRDVRAERISIDVGSGGVRAEAVTTDALSVDTGSGSVRLDLGKVPGRTEIDTGSGSVTIALPADAKADVDIDTGSGGISSDFAVSAETFRRSELRGRIGEGGSLIKVSTGSGGVRLVKR